MRRWLLPLAASALFALGLGSASADNWRSVARLESPRASLQAVTVDGQIYAAGGTTLTGPSDIFEAYDPRSNDWRPLESMPDGRDGFGMAAHGSVIFIAGGFSSLAKSKPTASVYAFDTTDSTWSRKADMPAARTGHTMTAVGDYVYVIGGRGAGTERVLRYDPGADKWESFGAPEPTPRSGHAAAALGTKIYVIGGRSASGAPLARVEVFDTESGKWSDSAALPIAVIGTTAGFVGTQLNIAGGTDPARQRTLNDHYLLSGGVWRKVASLPTPRQSLASAALGGQWYVIGGGAGTGALTAFTGTDDVEVYTP